MSPHHIAQLNVGVMVAPTDDPAVAEFMENLDRINAQADTADGFVWRLQSEQGNATDIQIFPNELQLVNMSVWESVETLKAYVYRTEHVEFFRRRAAWFEADGKRVALWSIAPGTIPTLADAVRRLEFMERNGPSPYAFGFAQPPPPLLFAAADDGDTSADALMARLGDPTLDDVERSICARSDGRTVGVGLLRRTGPTSARTEAVVDGSVEGLFVDAALVDQLELQAEELHLTVPGGHRTETT